MLPSDIIRGPEKKLSGKLLSSPVHHLALCLLHQGLCYTKWSPRTLPAPASRARTLKTLGLSCSALQRLSIQNQGSIDILDSIILTHIPCPPPPQSQDRNRIVGKVSSLHIEVQGLVSSSPRTVLLFHFPQALFPVKPLQTP